MNRKAWTRRAIRMETLEQRHLLASFGTPWPEPRSLTVSFPTENAQIGAYKNSIRTVLDQVTDRQEWQEATLRAFQTWAVESNINIGLTTDRGDHFGAVGLTQNDPRFGDFRIGAFPQRGVLANATPFQTNAGTWAGDVLVNTQTNYFLGDWAAGGTISVPPPNEKGPAVELFSVLLHEAGNALGLADVNRPGTVMHETYRGPLGRITAADRTAIRALYGGVRRDIYEPVANNLRSTATFIDQRSALGGRAPVIRQGSLNTIRDIDFYRFVPLPNQDKVTIRLKAEGISLLKSQLAVLDARGNVIADAKADSIFDNDLRLEIGSLRDHRQLFIRVAGNSQDVFAIGDYQIEIDYRPQSQQPVDAPMIYDADAVDDDDDRIPFNPAEAVDQIFARAGIIDTEVGRNDTRATATRLNSALGYNTNTRYETIGSLTVRDVDFLVFKSPATPSTKMSIRIETLGIATPTIHADVYDARGRRVPALASPSADGSVTLVVNNPTPNADYHVRIRAAARPVRTGNYVATIDFASSRDAAGEVVARGSATASRPSWTRMEVYKTQLFRLTLNAAATSTNTGVRVTIYDAKRATVVFSIATSARVVETDFAWLQRGEYVILAEAIGRGTVPTRVNFTLAAQGISDDQGPRPVDPSDPYGGTDPSDPYGGSNPADPYGGSNPFPVDPYGGNDPWISPIPDPYGGAIPFPFPPTFPNTPPQPPFDPPPPLDPWYTDPYYDQHMYG